MCTKLISKKNMLSRYIKIISYSYSQIFFSKNIVLGLVVLFISFFDFWIGLMGLLSVLVANQTAIWFQFNKKNINDGFYGFNALLVGLGTAVAFAPSLQLVVIVAIVSIFTLIVTIVAEAFLGKYHLPFLSLPFLFVLWTIDLSQHTLMRIGINERGVYHYNELYALGGKWLVDAHNLLTTIPYPFFLKEYFLSLSAIAFQYSEIGGVLIAIALFFSSRISFTLSIIGFYIAILFYQFAGISYHELSYTYIGFNYILTSIALGGIFLLPSKWTYLWMLILLPITVIITFASSQLFYYFGLSIYSLPFTIIVILFLYFLKLQPIKGGFLVEPIVQYNSPERNIYNHINNNERFPVPYYIPVSLPFMGAWQVLQGHSGKYTHLGEWKEAWDFVITKNNIQFEKSGDYVEDYFCYNKPVISPANGTIVEIIDGIEDNIIGQVNTLNNWGNTIIIKHSDLLYSKLSHLKSGSVKVKKGDFVQKGTLLATVGNSGRSPYPHLHFQFQAWPYVGSVTIKYPFESLLRYTKDEGFEDDSLRVPDILNYNIPQEEDRVANVETNNLLNTAFTFTPGERLKFLKLGNNITQVYNNQEFTSELEVGVDAYNQSYLKCLTTQAVAYYKKSGAEFSFVSFSGNKKSVLYNLYLSLYNVALGYYQDVEVTDSIPIDNVLSKRYRIVQDIIAPFYIYTRVNYLLKYVEVDSKFSPSEIKMQSSVTVKNITGKKEINSYKITVSKKGIELIKE